MYVQGDTLLLGDVFGNFQDKCLKMYEVELGYFISAPGLAWDVALKKQAKLELLTDIDMLLMVENGIRVGICYLYAESNNT